jgi:subtilisin family serine protease/subtilisin-like proprotein convertase family protein
MSHAKAPTAVSCRDLTSSKRVRQARAHARRRYRRLQAEHLEDRRLLAVADLHLDVTPPVESSQPPISNIFWQGDLRPVNPGHWIVSLDGVSTNPLLQLSQGNQLLNRHLGGNSMKLLRSLGGSGSLLLETDAGMSYSSVRAALSNVPGVRYVEPDFMISVDSTTPNDPSYSGLYGLNNTGQTGGTLDADIDAPEAWDLTVGTRSIVVGVIDSGVDYNHPDLAANIWTNPGEVAGDGVDNDGNGYVDDVHGYDFVNNDGDPMDDNGHGTHVSGTIGAVGNNSLGVVGVNWLSQIMGLKFLGSNGSGPISAAVSALNYATMMRNNYGVNIRLTNNSWGGGAFSQAMSDAITASGNAGMLFLAAAGNAASDIDATPYYPASYNLPSMIVVAATDSKDAIASYSNFGVNTVDLAAPGSSVLSTYPNNAYATMSGTSMATPHVSGAAALAWAYAPDATYQQIKDALFDGVDTLPALAGLTATGGRLNIHNSLESLPDDAGDTLSTARATRLLAFTPGDHFVLSSAHLGDGTYAAKDVDFYQLTATAGSSITATTSAAEGGTAVDTVLRLFNSTGNPVTINDNANGSAYSRLDYTFPTSGTYYLGISGAPNTGYQPNSGGSGIAGSTGDYRLDVSLDIGDTMNKALATNLVLGGQFTRPSVILGDGVSGDTDVDIFQFTAPVGSTLKAVTGLPAGGTPMDTLVRLFDSAGNELADNDSGVDLYSRLSYTFATAGTYFVGVSGALNSSYSASVAGSGVAGSTGTYSLELSLDVGDTLSTAVSTGLDGAGSFSQAIAWIGDGHYDGSDVDLYQLTADANSVLMAMTSQATGGTTMDTFLRVFDSNGNPLAAETNAPLFSRLHYIIPTTGTYYVGVSGANNNSYSTTVGGSGSQGSTGNYRLDLTLKGLTEGEVELSTLLATNADSSLGFVVSGLQNRLSMGMPRKYEPVGDINGDSIDDFLLASPSATTTPPTYSQAYLIFGQAGGFPTGIDLNELDGSAGYVINGVEAGDNLGLAGGGAGDLNGDGIPDLVLGAYTADPSSELANAGRAYVLFGGSSNLATLDAADGMVDGQIDPTEVNGDLGFMMNGTATNAYLGISIDAAGDVNQDGRDDLVVGSYGIGTVYVVFGRSTATPFPAVLDPLTLTGTTGFSVTQLATSDYLGTAVAGAGDVNGDGIDDLLLGAYGADPSGKSLAGQAYVIFGRVSFPAAVSLSSLDGTTGFTINGSLASGYFGYQVDGAGDVNGDGLNDMLVSAMALTGPGGTTAGAAYVVFGRTTPFASTMEIASLNGTDGVAFLGPATGAQVGYRLHGVGDVNGDTYDDILIGAPYADPQGLANAGQSFLVYGGPNFGASFELARLFSANGGDGTDGIVFNGFAAGDLAGSVSGLGDINADGLADLRIGANAADPQGLTNAGQAYILYGQPTPPRIRVMPSSGVTTSEAGGVVYASVLLTASPTSDVVIPISTSDPSEGTVNVLSLIFTPSNWDQPQPITITGVNDTFADGDKSYAIVFGAASSADSRYDGRNPADISVVNLDNDISSGTFTKTENKKIPDRGTYTSSLTVAPTGRILDLNVRVNIAHTWDEDLDVTLIAPDGTRIELFTDVGGSGVNFTNTVLDDEATTPITSGTAPFTGTYLPEGNLSLLEGKSLAGTWKLEAKDDEFIVSGTLIDWSITVRYTSAADGPQAIVTPTSGLVTTEAGGSTSFTVRLDNPPTADVIIPVSSSDVTEGTVSTSSLTFTTVNWASPQTVTVTGVDDSIVDGNVVYTLILGAATSADPDFHGVNPADVSATNSDNEVASTKFYVVNDATQNLTYEYSATGSLVESYNLSSGNAAPRGAASTVAGDKTWVVDANRNVYVYNTSGGLLGSWTAGTLTSTATVEGITTNGTDIWIVDAKSDKVYKYAGAASRLSGSQTATSSFSLNSGNRSPKDIVTDGTSLWVINNSTTDAVFKYTVAGSLLGSWTISSGGGSPTGITLDPSSVSNLWIVDNTTDRVYQFDAAASRTSGSQAPSTSFALAAGNTNPQGIADPPVPDRDRFSRTEERTSDVGDFSGRPLRWAPAPESTSLRGSRLESDRTAGPQVVELSRAVDAVMTRWDQLVEPTRAQPVATHGLRELAHRAGLRFEAESSNELLESTLALLAEEVATHARVAVVV